MVVVGDYADDTAVAGGDIAVVAAAGDTVAAAAGDGVVVPGLDVAVVVVVVVVAAADEDDAVGSRSVVGVDDDAGGAVDVVGAAAAAPDPMRATWTAVSWEVVVLAVVVAVVHMINAPAEPDVISDLDLASQAKRLKIRYDEKCVFALILIPRVAAFACSGGYQDLRCRNYFFIQNIGDINIYIYLYSFPG